MKVLKYCIGAFFLFNTATTHLYSEAIDPFIRRIHAHMLIDDLVSACIEAKEVLLKHPLNIKLHEAYIQALAKAGNEKEMYKAWVHYSTLPNNTAKENRELQEAMAWGILFKAAQSPSPIIRLASLIGGFFGEDAKSITLLLNALEDKNVALRCVAVKLSAKLRDAPLSKKILNLMLEDSQWKVRLAATSAAGSMQIKKAKPYLLAIIEDSASSLEEKAVAIESLIQLLDDLGRKEMVELAKSQRLGLRLLACEAINYLQSFRDVDLLIPLANDPCRQVRASALRVLGSMRIHTNEVFNLAIEKTQDQASEVSIVATWLLTLMAKEETKECFDFWLHHPEQEKRLLAASALAATGSYGLSLMEHFFDTTNDLFVKMNLALGMIQQNKNLYMAAEVLNNGLEQDSQRWMWKENFAFKTLAPSDLKYEDDFSTDPEAINQITRLDILNILSIVNFPKAQLAIKNFLNTRKWDVNGMAAALLLTEGDETAQDAVKALLHDSDPKLKLQAALVLSLWSHEEDSIALLQDQYMKSDRETKEKILESIGHIGSDSSIPFLIERFNEPQQILRIIAAGALLQCLYH